MSELPKTFIDVRDGKTYFIALQPIAKLVGLVKFLYFRHNGDWYAVNSEDTAKAVCREVRSRLRRNGEKMNSVHHWVNTLDPPPCACGRPGLFILRSVTYCRKCKASAQQIRTKVVAFHDKRYGEISDQMDQRSRKRTRMGRNGEWRAA